MGVDPSGCEAVADDATVSRSTTVDGDHGRIETRDVTVFQDAAWLGERHDWPGLNAVVMVESRRALGAGLAGRSARPASTSPR